jgi:hypothetical protein
MGHNSLKAIQVITEAERRALLTEMLSWEILVKIPVKELFRLHPKQNE